MSKAGADPGGRSRKAKRSGLTGRRAEWLAILWLTAKGYRLLERRFGGKGGEIDLVMKRGRTIAFVASMPPHVCVNEILISPTWNRSFVAMASH